MEHLTKEDELVILDQCTEDSFIGNGSSRAVFAVVYHGINCVAKIAIDTCGIQQNDNEFRVFDQAEDNGREDLFAAILAYGDTLLVCEKVDNDVDTNSVDSAINYDDYDSYKSDMENNDDFAFPENDFDRIHVIDEYITEITGRTDDNDQLGINNEGDLVLMDYGYDTNCEYSQEVGFMEDYPDMMFVVQYAKKVVNGVRKVFHISLGHTDNDIDFAELDRNNQIDLDEEQLKAIEDAEAEEEADNSANATEAKESNSNYSENTVAYCSNSSDMNVSYFTERSAVKVDNIDFSATSRYKLDNLAFIAIPNMDGILTYV